MKKSELKPGMKLIMGSGETYLFIGDNVMPSETGGWMPLERYKEDLSKIEKNERYSIKEIHFYDVLQHEWVQCLPDYLNVVQETGNISIYGKIAVQIAGNKTTVLFENANGDGLSAEASTTCLPEDVYNKDKGIRIATTKAIIKALHKELELLTK